MPTIKEIKELLKRVKQKSQKQKDQSIRPSPMPPLSPFTHGKPIRKQKEIKTLEEAREYQNNIYKAGY